MDARFVEAMLEQIYTHAMSGIGMGATGDALADFRAIRSAAASALKEFGREVHHENSGK